MLRTRSSPGSRCPQGRPGRRAAVESLEGRLLLSGAPPVFADMDGDGQADLVRVGPVGGPGVLVAHGNGDGTFAAPTAVPGIDPGSRVVAVATGDVNGDGANDLIVAQLRKIEPPPHRSPGGAAGVAGADAVADPAADAAASVAAADGPVRFTALLNDGSAHFTPGPVYLPPGPCKGLDQVGTADFDRNGRADFFFACDQGPRGVVGVVLSLRDGGFAAAPGPGADFPRGVDRVQAADINGDGRADLVGIEDPDEFVARGNGDGTFALPRRLAVPLAGGAGRTPFTLGDVNHDGIADVVGAEDSNERARPRDRRLFVALGRGDGTFGSTVLVEDPNIRPGGQPAVVLADLDGDGNADVFLITAVGDGSVRVSGLLFGDGAGGFAPAGGGAHGQ